MADNTGPLDITINTKDIKTTVPMVADGHYAKWKLANVSKQINDKGPALKFEWDLVDPAPNTEGGQILPGQMGAKLFENITLYDKNTTPPAIPKWASERIAKRQDALLGTGDAGNPKGKPLRPDFSPECVQQMLGKFLIAKMRVKTSDSGVNSEFASVVFPGDISA